MRKGSKHFYILDLLAGLKIINFTIYEIYAYLLLDNRWNVNEKFSKMEVRRNRQQFYEYSIPLHSLEITYTMF